MKKCFKNLIPSCFIQDFGDELLVRDKRESGLLCKYKKGDWSNCDPLTQVNIYQKEYEHKWVVQILLTIIKYT